MSSIAFGVAVSGMHYTAMDGMHFVPLSANAHHHAGGLAASQQILSLVVAVLCFVIAAGFLLSLVPDPRRQTAACRDLDRSGSGNGDARRRAGAAARGGDRCRARRG